MVTESYFRQYYETIYRNGEIYLWGANHEVIDKNLTDRLYRSFGSATYNKTYYDNKLKEGKGKYGSDCSGSIYPLSKSDNTARGYYNACLKRGPITSMDKNRCCLVFNAKFTHVGAYLGNGITIEMKSSKENCIRQNFQQTRWAYYGIPSWLVADTTVSDIDPAPVIKKAIDNNIIRGLQGAINNYMKDMPKWHDLNVDGEFGPKTLKAVVMAFQKYINDIKGTQLAVDGEFGPKTRRFCPAFKKGDVGFGIALIQTMLYIKGYNMSSSISKNFFDGQYGSGTEKAVTEYQSNTIGLRQDGIAGPATCYNLFRK